MEEIKGSQKNLRMLFQNMKYSIPYYQREYRWERKHIEEMIEDLTSEFLNHYHSGDSREQVKKYGAYFMGSIVIDSGENAIVDGQQRFSSLSLLLIYLNNRLHTIKQSYNLIEGMIFSESFGNKSFNINVEDRAACMKAMFNDEPFDASNSSESVKTLYECLLPIFRTDFFWNIRPITQVSANHTLTAPDFQVPHADARYCNNSSISPSVLSPPPMSETHTHPAQHAGKTH